jgi:Tol biopolymer transport system component
MSNLIPRLNATLDGRYAVDRQIGEGGMATVFLAQDLKHKRPVALKVLKPELSAVVGAERFLAEIETTASLQHPHILPLFDSGEADRLLFYVMPFVEGETLRDRLEREGQLPVDEAIRIAKAVASALDYAHRHGVVHRDIKPANILLQDGQPVVSDFGIALAIGAAGGRLTETGLSVGTPYYMSPEQATGDQSIGPASDTYSLAAVLYEMLVGEPPYPGKTAQAVLGKILQGQAVSATSMRRSIPPNVDAAIRKGLERLPADRFTRADDFARALSDPGFRHGVDTSSRDEAPSPARRLVAAAGWVVAAALGGVLLWGPSPPAPVAPAGRFTIPEPDGSSFGRDGQLLPDGSGVLYVSESGRSDPMLWIRRWDESAGTPVAGTEGVGSRVARTSPDGNLVAFVVGYPGPLRVAPVLGGAVRTLVERSYGVGPWAPDGRTLYFVTDGAGIAKVDVDGVEGPTQLFPDPFPDSVAPVFDLIPARNALLFRHGPTSDFTRGMIKALDLGTGEVTPIVEGTGPAFVTPDGDLAYGTADGSLMVAPFDVPSLAITGAPAQVEAGLGTDQFSIVRFSISEDGSLLYLPGAGVTRGTPVWVDRAGRTEPVDRSWSPPVSATYSSLALSPEGDRIALALPVGGGRHELFVKRLADGALTRIPPVGPTDNRRASWSADGRSLIFVADAQGSISLWSIAADASSPPEEVRSDPREILEGLVTPGGDWLVYRVGSNSRGQTDDDILGVRLGTNEDPIPLVDTDAYDRQPTVSPNGRWLAYESTQSGRSEVYVRPFPQTGAWREQVSISGGSEPVWSRDGAELFYRGETQYVSVRVSGQEHIELGQRTELFPAEPFLRGLGHPMYDVTRDGRFLMILLGETTSSAAVLVRGWSQAVARQLGR